MTVCECGHQKAKHYEYLGCYHNTNGKYCVCEEYRERKETPMTLVTVTLPNGIVVTGTTEQVDTVARSFGYSAFDPTLYYKSSHLGWVKISEMSTDHLGNAIRKMMRTWAADLSNKKGKDMVNTIALGNQDKTYRALVSEYLKRFT